MTCSGISSAQVVMTLINPSFEGIALIGESSKRMKSPLEGWQVWCLFESKSTPDIHGHFTNFWNTGTQPFHGETFVGLVAREDSTWECLGQYLEEPLQAEGTYALSITVCQDPGFLGFMNPTVIRIWGTNEEYGFEELLATSEPVINPKWKEYTFDLLPSKSYQYLIIQAYYPADSIVPTSGHVLIDNARLVKYE